jgi:hypothetical protein
MKCDKCGKEINESCAGFCSDCYDIQTMSCLSCGKVCDALYAGGYCDKCADSMYNMSETDNNINNPQHYTFGKYEVVDVLLDWFHDDPLLYNVGKYIARAKHKGKFIADLKKAIWYLNKRLELEENNERKD